MTTSVVTDGSTGVPCPAAELCLTPDPTAKGSTTIMCSVTRIRRPSEESFEEDLQSCDFTRARPDLSDSCIPHSGALQRVLCYLNQSQNVLISVLSNRERNWAITKHPLFSQLYQSIVLLFSILPKKKTLTVLDDFLEHNPWCAISEIREHYQSLLRRGTSDRFTLVFHTECSLERNQETSNSKLVFSLLNPPTSKAATTHLLTTN